MRMENRYADELRVANQAILALIPANQVLRYEVACEIRNRQRPGLRVLEIGGGEGDSTLPVLDHTEVSLDFLDVAPEMISLAKQRLGSYKDRVRYVTEDALSYLESCDHYDVIFSEWTIHNFVQEDKVRLLKAIQRKVKPGGVFILMDKVWPQEGGQALMELQFARHRYLDEDARREIIEHEQQDAGDAYRMDEVPFLSMVREAGFSEVTILDRVERDIVLVANVE